MRTERLVRLRCQFCNDFDVTTDEALAKEEGNAHDATCDPRRKAGDQAFEAVEQIVALADKLGRDPAETFAVLLARFVRARLS